METMLESPTQMTKFRPAPRIPPYGVNVFRDAWEYRITAAGHERLATGKGASPAFMQILRIAHGTPVTFADVASQFDHISGDDLELWLSAMCTMGLLAPVQSADLEVQAPLSNLAPSTPTVADVSAAQPLALLVHADAKARANWRRALGASGFDFSESGELETVERLIRERRPTWVVLGLKGTDFDGLHLLKALKRPRAPSVSKVCLVLPRGKRLSPEEAEIAARADATAGTVQDIVHALNAVRAADTVGTAEAFAALDNAAPHVAPGIIADPAPVPESAVAPALARPCARPPANAPVWMNLLYAKSFEYGSFETDHPAALESQYPRLMVRMIEGWSKPEFGDEIRALIVDDRGDRAGFPPDVMEEIWLLHQMHQQLHQPG